MIASEYKGSDNEVMNAYYEIYMYNLDEEFYDTRKSASGI